MGQKQLEAGDTLPFKMKLVESRPFWVTLSEFSISTVLAVILYMVALITFFFTISAKIEKIAVNKNTDRIVSDLLQDMKTVLKPDQLLRLQTQFSMLHAPDMKEEDDSVEQSNKVLVKSTIQTSGMFVVGGLGLIFLIYGFTRLNGFTRLKKGKKAVVDVNYPSLFNIVIENLIITAFIFGTEVTFMLLIGMHWRSIDENAVKLAMVDTIYSFITKKP